MNFHLNAKWECQGREGAAEGRPGHVSDATREVILIWIITCLSSGAGMASCAIEMLGSLGCTLHDYSKALNSVICLAFNCKHIGYFFRTFIPIFLDTCPFYPIFSYGLMIISYLYSSNDDPVDTGI